MTSLHYLNVGAGDCTIIQHPSGRTTMVDICGGNLRGAGALPVPRSALGLGALPRTGNALRYAAGPPNLLTAFAQPRTALSLGALPGAALLTGALSQARGNFAMDDERKNPLDYVTRTLGLTAIFRFISTHPEMDHLDGLDALFRTVNVANFWCTGVQRLRPDFGLGCPYKSADWDRYVAAKSSKIDGTTLQVRLADAYFPYANQESDGSVGGDGIYILAPTAGMVQAAQACDDMNEASYVLMILSPAGSIIIPGDAHDSTWEFVIRSYWQYVHKCALLLAPHHGRDSDRDYAFLDALQPRLTLMGCAPSKDMGYASWRRRKLPYITNNQAGAIRVDATDAHLRVWVENASYATARGLSALNRNAHGLVYAGAY